MLQLVIGGKNYERNLEKIDPAPEDLAHWTHKETQSNKKQANIYPFVVVICNNQNEM